MLDFPGRFWCERKKYLIIFLGNCELKVVLDDLSSADYSINPGVPKGSALGPHLFFFLSMIYQTILSSGDLYR